jgi:hypothetical protein
LVGLACFPFLSLSFGVRVSWASPEDFGSPVVQEQRILSQKWLQENNEIVPLEYVEHKPVPKRPQKHKGPSKPDSKKKNDKKSKKSSSQSKVAVSRFYRRHPEMWKVFQTLNGKYRRSYRLHLNMHRRLTQLRERYVQLGIAFNKANALLPRARSYLDKAEKDVQSTQKPNDQAMVQLDLAKILLERANRAYEHAKLLLDNVKLTFQRESTALQEQIEDVKGRLDSLRKLKSMTGYSNRRRCRKHVQDGCKIKECCKIRFKKNKKGQPTMVTRWDTCKQVSKKCKPNSSNQ